ncbi:endonuclease domain-containing protein [Pontibacter aydingkolensis]|uniref:Endonuclease domain-containing protein n=1 Tax=Pontibacter aydingkolensis TaxID=1911536 RepID=A0ABS7CQC9_9BACT|nr:endonuclease domain-containing protein [Pontibacter aydingkolensis]MBW7466040.1 endonuclease domain-containing protein [Pontibacter aydingkolensis]
MRNDQLHSLPKLRQVRSRLRSNMTPAEKELWGLLRKRRLGSCKFRRQHSIGNYIVDFYCASEKLVIEVDGSVHDTPEAIANDKVRDETLQNLGYKVVRIRNSEVFAQPEQILQRISATFKQL